MPEWVKWIAFVVGLGLFVATTGSVMRNLIVPRGLSSRLGTTVGKLVRKSFLAITNRFDEYEPKDRILALQAPVFLIVQLVTWITLYFLSFALMLWPFEGTLLTALRESGSSLFTLGFASRDFVAPTLIHFVAALTGLVVIALQIAYLPTLYGAFNRRETLITVLQSRAGSPAWGPEILARHAMTDLTGDLPNFYAEWERWAADVAETHTNYVVLLYFRSPHALRSWLIGLLAVMDSAAMLTALNPSTAPVQARLMLRMGFVCLRNIASVIGIPYDPDPMPDDPLELTFEEFEGSLRRMKEFDFPIERTAAEAWPHFRGWRVNYESIAYALADLIVAPPGPWSGPRTHLPDLTIIPQRPANRKPDDRQEDKERVKTADWQA